MQHAEFLEQIADKLGESLPTIKQAHRVLREAGVLEGKRGKHAPQRSAADAAVFLCWIGITEKPSLAPMGVTDFGNSRRVGSRGDLPQFFNVDDAPTLLDALRILVQAAIDGSDSERSYVVEFEADELSVAIDFGSARARYSRDTDPDADLYAARYGRPFRVCRVFPREFIRSVASIFAAADDTAIDQAA